MYIRHRFVFKKIQAFADFCRRHYCIVVVVVVVVVVDRWKRKTDIYR